jgi:hypothetical protein
LELLSSYYAHVQTSCPRLGTVPGIPRPPPTPTSRTALAWRNSKKSLVATPALREIKIEQCSRKARPEHACDAHLKGVAFSRAHNIRSDPGSLVAQLLDFPVVPPVPCTAGGHVDSAAILALHSHAQMPALSGGSFLSGQHLRRCLSQPVRSAQSTPQTASHQQHVQANVLGLRSQSDTKSVSSMSGTLTAVAKLQSDISSWAAVSCATLDPNQVGLQPGCHNLHAGRHVLPGRMSLAARSAVGTSRPPVFGRKGKHRREASLNVVSRCTQPW